MTAYVQDILVHLKLNDIAWLTQRETKVIGVMLSLYEIDLGLGLCQKGLVLQGFCTEGYPLYFIMSSPPMAEVVSCCFSLSLLLAKIHHTSKL